MAMYLFADAIMSGCPLRLFNHGNMRRDFTYIDDVVEAVVRLLPHIPKGSGGDASPGTSAAPWRIYNIGNNRPENVMHVVALMERELERTAAKEMLPMQPGDVLETYADISDLTRDIGFRPKTSIEDGIRMFVAWYRDYRRR